MTNLGDPDPDMKRIRQPNSGCTDSYSTYFTHFTLEEGLRLKETSSLPGIRVNTPRRIEKGARQLQIRVLWNGYMRQR